MKKIVLVLVFLALVVSCAKRGSPSGGKKDMEAPEIVKSFPENYSTNFNTKEIRINFNEYIKLKDLNKQLIVSPPLKYQPTIIPQSGASKQLKIKILDTLQENTTYSFNFGNSIVDNNEGNPFPFFRYVFSTGTEIDSLQLKGTVKDALNVDTDSYVSVLLYEIDSTYSDSTVYLKKPRYITNTLDSATTFQFNNIKKGTYKLIALKEESDNYVFNQKTDKIGFVETEITLPTSQEYELLLFKEIQNFKPLKPKHQKKNRIRFRYEGPYHEDISIKLLTDNLPEGYTSIITKEIETDTLNYWFKPSVELDSMLFSLKSKKVVDTFKVRMRKKIKADSLYFKKITQSLTVDEKYEISSSIPIIKIDKQKIQIMNKDSVLVPFKIEQNSFTNTIGFDFDKKEEDRYKITAYPEAFQDFYGGMNDTLTFKVSTKKLSAYGTIKLELFNTPKHSLLVQLVDKNGKIKYEQKGVGKTIFDFQNLNPATYNLRVVFDVNGNEKYDTGNYLNKLQPERVSYYPEEIEIRANWDRDYKFTLQ
ncbi:Ig-like domain-containing protein [Pseudofulvibacter geojedonensis]|uniref:Ig-like domain-containing protein n=1 Tax=Pseudofulvibacter geojedonensis TaxID=1123758 RepID=A0ABW3I0U1_9FLAO